MTGSTSGSQARSVAKAPAGEPLNPADKNFPGNFRGAYTGDGVEYDASIFFGPKFPLITLDRATSLATVTATITTGRLTPKRSEDGSEIEVPGRFFRMVATFNTVITADGKTRMPYRNVVEVR